MKKNAIVIGVIILGLIAVLLYSEKRRVMALRPSDGQTLVGLFETREVLSIRKFVYHGNIYVQVIGKLLGTSLSLPSGPPVYIFNTKGILVDWSSDIGDDTRFVERWGGFSNAASVSKDEATRLVNVESRIP